MLLLLSATGCTQARPDAETAIRNAESSLVLPEGADSLESYDRFYAVEGASVVGAYRSTGETGRITIVGKVDDLPFRADGGCSFIQVRLDLPSKSWTQVICNGFA
jgi:hypothetical protein